MADPELTYALELRFTNYVTNAFVLALRAALAHPFTPEKFRYHLTDPSKRQVAIYRGWPKRQTSYPCILVETDPGDFSITTVGQEEGYVIQNEQGVDSDIIYAGQMNLPVKLTIVADSATDREKLTDLVSIYVRFVFRDKFYKANIPYIGIDAGAAGEEVVDGKVYYKGSITVHTQPEFQQKIDLSLLAAVEAIDLSGVLLGTSNADVQPNEGG